MENCGSFKSFGFIYIYIYMSNSMVPSNQKKKVRYPLISNLLHHVTFFSNLTVSSSHCTVPTSHIIVIFSHLVVSLLFSHIWWFPYFFLTFDDSILTLCSSNITCDIFFLTFGSSLTFFFLHLTVLSSHYVVLTSHMTVLLSH